jgi:hypothetical protein
VRTPPPITASLSSDNVLHDLEETPLESFGFQSPVQEALIGSDFSDAFQQSQVIELANAAEINSGIETSCLGTDHYLVETQTSGCTTVYIEQSSEWHFSGHDEIDWASALQPPYPNTGQTHRWGLNSLPRRKSVGQRLSPVSQYFDFETFDILVDTEPLITNLPWFRLQSTLEQPGMPSFIPTLVP